MTALLALGFVDPARAQFGPDFRLTAAPFPSLTSNNDAWSIATDKDHNIHVAYVDSRNAMMGDIAPYYRLFNANAGVWGPEVRLPDAPVTSSQRGIAIATDCEGSVYFLWTQMAPNGESQLVLKRRTPEGIYQPDAVIRTSPASDPPIIGPSIDVDMLQCLYVVWSEGKNNVNGQPVYNVYVRMRDRFGFWSDPVALTSYVANVNPTPGASMPTIAAENDFAEAYGVTLGHVAWSDWNQGSLLYRPIMYDIGDNTFSLGPQQNLGNGVGGAPSIRTDCFRIHVVWTNHNGLIRHRIGLGDHLGMTSFIPEVGTGFGGNEPNVAIDRLGNVHLVISLNDSVFYHRWSLQTGTWGPAVIVRDVPGTPAERPSIATDDRGGVHVVWTDYRDDPAFASEVYFDGNGCLTLPQPPTSGPSILNDGLQAALTRAKSIDRLPVIAVLRERPDLDGLRLRVAGHSLAERRRIVVDELSSRSRSSQAPIHTFLMDAEASGDAAHVGPLLLANAIALEASPDLIQRLASRSDLTSIIHDPPESMLEREPEHRNADPIDDQIDPIESKRLMQPSPIDTAWGVRWIGAPQVWAQGYRGDCVLVAVIDTGMDMTHPDLAARIWRNADETANNGLDDDGNGYIDDVHGYDFANNDADPSDGDPGSHGTHVSGTIAGNGANGTATGVAPGALLMPLKVIGSDGTGTNASVLAAIEYALMEGAQVMNLSLGGGCKPAGIRDLFREDADAAMLSGVTMCVAAGNSRCVRRPPNITTDPGDVPPPWLNPAQPVLGTTSGITTVGATRDHIDGVTTFSSPGPVDWSQSPVYGDWALCSPAAPNVGLIKPDVSAPGQHITSTIAGGGYDIKDGTSMATPHVTGLVALMLSKNGTLLSSQIESILETTAIDIAPAGKDNDTGAGRVRAPEAIAAVAPPPVPILELVSHAFYDTIGTGNGNGRLGAGESADVVLYIQDTGPYGIGDVTGLLSVGGGDTTITVTKSTAVFGDIDPGEVVPNLGDPFRVRVKSSAPAGHVVTFNAVLFGNGACATVVFADTLEAPAAVEGGGPTEDGDGRARGSDGSRLASGLQAVLPNPAHGEAVFVVLVDRPDPARVVLTIHDLGGRRVRTLVSEDLGAGVHRFHWDGSGDGGHALPPGIYAGRCDTGGKITQRKFLLLGR